LPEGVAGVAGATVLGALEGVLVCVRGGGGARTLKSAGQPLVYVLPDVRIMCVGRFVLIGWGLRVACAGKRRLVQRRSVVLKPAAHHPPPPTPHPPPPAPLVPLTQCSGFWHGVYFDSEDHVPHKFKLNFLYMIEGLFGAGAVMISFGAVIGRLTPSQLVVMTFFEVRGANRVCQRRRGPSSHLPPSCNPCTRAPPGPALPCPALPSAPPDHLLLPQLLHWLLHIQGRRRRRLHDHSQCVARGAPHK
jgi:hypothetical protein